MLRKLKLTEEIEIGAEFKCRTCGAVVVSDVYEIIDAGNPTCGRCDVEMKMTRSGKVEEVKEKA